MRLTAKSTIGQWLEDPVGSEVLGRLLAAGGSDASALAPMGGLPLERLVPMSQGMLTDDMVSDLVRQVREASGEPFPDEETSEQGEVEDERRKAARPMQWTERITPGRFEGQTVIVTGAGSGIGRATASRIAREGGRVIAVDVSEPRLQELAESLPDADVVTLTGDITDDAAVASIVEAAGEVHALANVAGIMDNMTPVGEVADEVWERVMRVNVTGMMKLTRAVVPGMVARGGGSIVNVASEAALRGSAAGVAYTTSKHAVVGLTRSTAFMYGPAGVRTNAVAPGGVATNIEARFDSPLGADRVGTLLPLIPPPTQPEALAASITFLLSDDGVNVNGAVLPSDGGWSVQ